MATTTISLGPEVASTSSPIMASCTTAVPGAYGYVPFDPNTCNSNYHFYPSFTGNLAFATVFGLSTIAHLIEAIVFKKKFCWVVIMGGAWETGAFIARTLGSRDQQEEQFAFWGQLLFILAPLWVNAFVYMTVARMVHFGLADKQIWNIKATKLTVLFVWIDVVCFLIQAGGGGMLSNKDEPNIARIGTKVYTAGVAIQMTFVIIFGAMTAWFYRRIHQMSRCNNGRMKGLTLVMLAVLLLIVIRTVYRLIEFGPGLNADNPLITKEIYPFALDALPMILALTMLNVMHPGFVLRGMNSEFPSLSRAERTAIRRQKKKEHQQSRATNSACENREYIRMEHMG
ncbi:RTA1 like protein-domain-containing protein [Thelonectria olida]|uniref:RTA1 like protein-domain-containing protein n=1 Tax=Thelonectria olida TaxID=1576542 RepID=A0A9P8VXJ3_9HYPO|nr:RTA1 like protein-domain-containing protein [Thelonectria olida]